MLKTIEVKTHKNNTYDIKINGKILNIKRNIISRIKEYNYESNIMSEL